MTLWEETEDLQVSAGQQLVIIFKNMANSVDASFLGSFTI